MIRTYLFCYSLFIYLFDVEWSARSDDTLDVAGRVESCIDTKTCLGASFDRNFSYVCIPCLSV